MIELIEANWPLFVIALLIGLLVAWWIFVSMRRTRVETDKSDVLDEGNGPAARNQALIDAPPAASTPIPVPPVDEHSPLNRETVAVTPVEVSPPAPSSDPVMANTVRPTVAAAATVGAGDDLTRIKGIGPKLRTMLAEHDVTDFAQIAGWSEADIDAIDAKLGKFQGRIRRDDWVAQARMLGAGDTAGYESQFGKL